MKLINYIFNIKNNNYNNDNYTIKIYFNNGKEYFNCQLKENKTVIEIIQESKKIITKDIEEDSNNYTLKMILKTFINNKNNELNSRILNNFEKIKEILKENIFKEYRLYFEIIKIKNKENVFNIKSITENNNNKEIENNYIRFGIVKLKKNDGRVFKDINIFLTKNSLLYNKINNKNNVIQIPLLHIKNVISESDTIFKIQLDHINYYQIKCNNNDECNTWMKTFIYLIKNCKENNQILEIKQNISKIKSNFDPKFLNLEYYMVNNIDRNNFELIFNIFDFLKNELFYNNKDYIVSIKEILEIILFNKDFDRDIFIKMYTELIDKYKKDIPDIQYLISSDYKNLKKLIFKLNGYLEIKTIFNKEFITNYFQKSLFNYSNKFII